MYVTMYEDTGDTYPASVELNRRRHRNLSATQLVWAKLERTAASVALVRRLSDPMDPDQHAVLQQCEERLRMARDRINRPIRQTWAFWELVHRVEEELLLVTPEELLQAEATDVLAKFERKISDLAVRAAWLGPDGMSGPLPSVVRRLRVCEPVELRRPHQLRPGDRDILRGALNLVNEQGDIAFWRLGSNVSVQTFSAALLVLLLLVALLRLLLPGGIQLPVEAGPPDTLDILMLGAAGAIVSNLIATKPFILSIGPTSRYYVHNLFVKPVIGAFTAGLVHFLERSGILLIGSPQGSASGFARCIVAVAAGFAGEWMLRPMMDKVLRAMSAESEKGTTSVRSGRAETLDEASGPTASTSGPGGRSRQ